MPNVIKNLHGALNRNESSLLMLCVQGLCEIRIMFLCFVFEGTENKFYSLFLTYVWLKKVDENSIILRICSIFEPSKHTLIALGRPADFFKLIINIIRNLKLEKEQIGFWKTGGIYGIMAQSLHVNIVLLSSAN